MSDNAKILVVTTTFPRHDGDDQPRFVLDLCNALADQYEQLVVAPSEPGCDSIGKVEGIRVKRFRYFFRGAVSPAVATIFPPWHGALNAQRTAAVSTRYCARTLVDARWHCREDRDCHYFR